MRRDALALCALLLCVAPAGGFVPRVEKRDAPSTVLRNGPVEGDWVELSPRGVELSPRVARFRGIPYGADTGFEGRWRPPTPVAAWGPAPLLAKAWGPACVQEAWPSDPDGAAASHAQRCALRRACFADGVSQCLISKARTA